MTGWINHLVESYGLGLLFVVVALESAGLPLPGETALIFAGVWASKGHLEIEWVIAVAALAAIVGDNVGYWLGRTGGRALVYRYAWSRKFAERVVPPSERFFERHGAKTVFLARFIAGLRDHGRLDGRDQPHVLVALPLLERRRRDRLGDRRRPGRRTSSATRRPTRSRSTA